VLKVVIR